jgi:hypothetical protein
MDTKEKKFEEQDHPLKNTDQAFVQVGKDGSPVIPNTADDKKTGEKTENTSTTIERS